VIGLGGLLLAWLSLAMLVGALAAHWNRNGFAWFVLAAVASPLFAVAWLCVLGDERPRCIHCRDRVFATATACRHCGRDL
jgi:hypothetical protein